MAAEGNLSMAFLKLLEGIRNPFFDWFFSLITLIGDETVFLVIALVVFWCVSKRDGYYLLFVGFFGQIINNFLKLIFRIPRPFVIDKTLTTVGNVEDRALGYSFPSGHTQNIAGTLGTVHAKTKRLWVKITCIVIIVLVAFSRMYLGVHTPLDVIVSLGIALVLVLALYPMFKTEERFEKCMPYLVIAAILFSLAYMLYFPIFKHVHLDTSNLEAGLEFAYTFAGCTMGLAVVYFVDSSITKFDTRATWYMQIAKLIVGFGIVIAIKEGLDSPLVFICGGKELIARMIRYFLIVSFAGAVWPLTFKFFASKRIAALDNFGNNVLSFFKKRDTDATLTENEAPKPASRRMKKAKITAQPEMPSYPVKKKRKQSWRTARKNKFK